MTPFDLAGPPSADSPLVLTLVIVVAAIVLVAAAGVLLWTLKRRP